jgi:hypothetical protein
LPPKELLKQMIEMGDYAQAEYNVSIGYASLFYNDEGWSIAASDEEVAKYLEELINED